MARLALGLPFVLLAMVLFVASPMVTFAKSSSDSDSKGTSQQQPTSTPDKDCAFNPSLAKCAPDPTTGKCPSGFSAGLSCRPI